MESRQDIETIRKRVYDNNKHFRENRFEILERVKRYDVIVRDKYGICRCGIRSLLNGYLPNILGAVDKKQYFMNRLKDINPKIYNEVEIVDYISSCNVILNSKYGFLRVNTDNVLKWDSLSIQSAINKTEFWVKRCKDIMENFEKTDYSKVKYVSKCTKVQLMCKEHNIAYKQRPAEHITGSQGCPLCMSQVIKYTEENFKKHYEFLKGLDGVFYIIRLKSGTEDFYKVGITQKHRIKYRFDSMKSLYKVEIIYTENMSLSEAFENEQLFLREFKEYSYKPNKHFTGHTECLTVNPLEYYYYYFKQNNTTENEQEF